MFCSCKCWYRTATTSEIKTAYRKLALVLHPDRHEGSEDKIQAFRDASEAYQILTDTERRRQYDIGMNGGGGGGGWWFRSTTTNHPTSTTTSHRTKRSSSPPPNYRKVYAPHAPPDGKWHDAQRHYDMHYGDGMYHEELKKAHDRAKERGDLEYHSPLGKGFSFDGLQEDRTKYSYTENSYFKNPYSKVTQGPPTLQWEYVEGVYLHEAKTVLKQKSDVVDRLRSRRAERYAQQQQQQEQQAAGNTSMAGGSYESYNQANASCSIM